VHSANAENLLETSAEICQRRVCKVRMRQNLDKILLTSEDDYEHGQTVVSKIQDDSREPVILPERHVLCLWAVQKRPVVLSRTEFHWLHTFMPWRRLSLTFNDVDKLEVARNDY
jgi:hypothetical protein